MNVNIHRAMATSDYDCGERRAELRWLAEQASKRRSIVEVGSYKGTTARAMADNTFGTVYCVDTFAGSVGEIQMAQELAAHEPDWLFKTFFANTQDLSNIKIIRKTSIEAAAQFAEFSGRFDMIFLDASHDYDSVAADLRAWMPLLSPGGLLCGHDRSWDGVSKAINELVPGHKVGIGAIWYRLC